MIYLAIVSKISYTIQEGNEFMNKFLKSLLVLLLSVSVAGCSTSQNSNSSSQSPSQAVIDISSIPVFDDKPYVELNGNIPSFTEDEKGSIDVVEKYSELDALGRCGVAFANLHVSNMPTDERGSIGMIRPTGWHTVKYDFVNGKYLYNRCHLIGFQLAGENANDKNLITGTRYLNTEGMLPWENKVAEYLKETNNHVLYRVTPIFKEDELVARGIQMEAYSVEDNGQGIQFNIYCYNNQPGVNIDYTSGESNLTDKKEQEADTNDKEQIYVINISSKKFHIEDCPNAVKISQKNKETKKVTISQLIEEGYEAAKCCIDK